MFTACDGVTYSSVGNKNALKTKTFAMHLIMMKIDNRVKLKDITISKLVIEETVHANVKIGLPLSIADCLSDCLLYCSSHFTYLPTEKERI